VRSLAVRIDLDRDVTGSSFGWRASLIRLAPVCATTGSTLIVWNSSSCLKLSTTVNQAVVILLGPTIWVTAMSKVAVSLTFAL
jgi:hypothetical protein